MYSSGRRDSNGTTLFRVDRGDLSFILLRSQTYPSLYGSGLTRRGGWVGVKAGNSVKSVTDRCQGSLWDSISTGRLGKDLTAGYQSLLLY